MTPPTENRLSLIIPISLLALLFFLAGLIRIESLWGINHLKYMPPYFAIFFGISLILAIMPSTNRYLRNFVGRLSNWYNNLPYFGRFLFVAAISTGILYLLRVNVHSLGDGYQRIYQIEKGYTYYHSEPLDFLLHAGFYRALKLIGNDSAELTYTLFSTVGGIAFILSVVFFRLPDKIEKPIGGLIKFLLITFGGIQMFCGYVESYTMVYIFGLLYLLYAWRFLIEKKGLLLVSILLTIAIISHITAFFLLPGFIYLVAYNFKHIRPKSFTARFLPLLIVALPILAFPVQEYWLRYISDARLADIGGGILPFFSAGEYSILSAGHLLDVINEILLIAPIALVLIVFFILNHKKDSLSIGLRNFAGLSIIFSFLFILVIDPKIGFARDWDLFSTPAAALGFSVAVITVSGIVDFARNGYRIFLTGSVAMLFLISWLSINAVEDYQLKRGEELLELSDKGQGYGLELLAYHYKIKKEDNVKSLELLNKITGVARNARVYNKIAQAELDLGRYQDAFKSIYAGLAIDSNTYNLHVQAGFTWLEHKKPEKAMPHLKKAFLLDRSRFEIMHSIGNAYFQMDSLLHAALAFKHALSINPRFPAACFEAGNMYRMLKMYDSALVYTKKGLRLDPNYPGGIQLLSSIESEIRSVGGDDR